jgi:hypothetical protein
MEKMVASQYNIYLHKRKQRHDEHEGEDQGNNTEMYYRKQRCLKYCYNGIIFASAYFCKWVVDEIRGHEIYSSRAFWMSFSIDIGVVDVAYLSMTFPFLSTRNLVKFHLILDPNKPGLLAFRNL